MGKSDTARDDTRENLLNAAVRQFAERGFYGASIAQIAGELDLTKQALLYYFRRKEDLYVEVLKRISERLINAMRFGVEAEQNRDEQFESMILRIYDEAQRYPLDTKVLMRELVDNQRRDSPAETWHFKPILDEVTEQLDLVSGLTARPFPEKFACVYQILSAIQYFTASSDALTRMYGEEEFAAIKASYRDELRGQVRRLIECGDGC